MYMPFHDFPSAAQTIYKQSGPERQFSGSKLIFSLVICTGNCCTPTKKVTSTKKRLFKYSLLIQFQPTLRALGAKAPSSDCLDSLHWRFANRKKRPPDPTDLVARLRGGGRKSDPTVPL